MIRRPHITGFKPMLVGRARDGEKEFELRGDWQVFQSFSVRSHVEGQHGFDWRRESN